MDTLLQNTTSVPSGRTVAFSFTLLFITQTATFDRGFKTLAERTSANIRHELGLGAHDCLDVFRLAEFLEVKICTQERYLDYQRKLFISYLFYQADTSASRLCSICFLTLPVNALSARRSS